MGFERPWRRRVEPYMKRVMPVLFLLSAFAAIGCLRKEMHDAQIDVEGMTSDRDTALVTNAAQRELMGELPPIRHECRIDPSGGRVVYYEGPRLSDTAYQRRILAALAEIGYPATIRSVRHDPPRRLRIAGIELMLEEWPDRFSMELELGGMDTSGDANRVADAIAYARLGCRPVNLEVDPGSGTVTIRNQSRRLATPLNYAFAIATAGFTAGPLAAYDEITAPPRGWLPIDG